MARCGCGSTCACSLQAGVGTTVTGAGTPANPWIINAGSENALVAQDTPCIDMIVTGTGAADDPYVVRANPIIAPEPNGLECSPTGLAVIPSSDPGNILSVGADGRLFSPPPGTSSATVMQALDTPCIDMTLTGAGTLASPFVISAVPIIAAEPNGLSCTPTGLTVRPSTDAGNTLTIGADGNLYTPVSGFTPGCGVMIDGLGRAAVNTGGAVWPFTCPQTAGDDVYCDPATGRVHVAPEKFINYQLARSASFTASRTGQTSSGTGDWAPGSSTLPTVGGTPRSQNLDTPAEAIVNPSTCHDMRVVIRFGIEHAQVNLDDAGGTAAGFNERQVILQPVLTVTGGPNPGVFGSGLSHQVAAFSGVLPNSSRAFTFDSSHTEQIIEIVLAPGQSFTLSVNMTVEIPFLESTGRVTVFSGSVYWDAWSYNF